MYFYKLNAAHLHVNENNGCRNKTGLHNSHFRKNIYIVPRFEQVR
jgi:hypothetical protein